MTQPRVSDLMRGKIDLFALDTLVNMAVAAGLQLELRNPRRPERSASLNRHRRRAISPGG